MWSEERQDFIHYDKSFGKALTPETIMDGFLKYIPSHFSSVMRMEILSAIQAQVRKILDDLQQWQLSLMLYSSSLLIVYEGSLNAVGFGGDFKVRVKLIDFAHSYFEQGLNDSGAANGLYRFSNLLDEAILNVM